MTHSTDEALQTAQVLLDDLETPGTAVETILLRCRRLARLTDDQKMHDWLLWEYSGYGDSDECRDFMMFTYRDKPGGPYYISGTQLAPALQGLSEQLAAIRIPDVSGEYALATIVRVTQSMSDISAQLAIYRGIEAGIRSYAHTFAVKHYYRLKLDNRQQSMFRAAQSNIDVLLNDLDGRTLQRFDSAYERLQAGDSEAIAHALTSCRRLLDLAADGLFPATDRTRSTNGQPTALGQRQVLNRLKAFVDDHVISGSAQTRLKQQLTNLYNRTSAGVHSDVTAAEARYIFLNTYIVIGELIELRDMLEEAVSVDVAEAETP